MGQEIILTGISRQKYHFGIFDVNASWNSLPGLYAFADLEGYPKYIGETESFATRRPGPGHEKWNSAKQYGAKMVLALVLQDGEQARKAAEADLIRAYNPPCNIQHRPRGRGASLLLGEVI